MKVKTGLSGMLQRIKKAIVSIAVLGIILVVPVFSILEFGRFFHGGNSRSSAPLPAMTIRPADSTDLPAQLFQEPLISVTFDDGYQSIYTSALPLLQKYGIRSTQYVLTGTSDHADYVSWKQIGEMQRAGHEIACHTVDHADLTTLTSDAADLQLRECKNELTKRYGDIPNFASPYGAHNAGTLSLIRKHFDSHRNTYGNPTDGIDEWDVNIGSHFDKYNIMAVTVRHDTKLSDLQALVSYAGANNGWLVLTYHQADDGGSQYGVNPKNLEKHFNYLSRTDVRIVTMRDALASTVLQEMEY